jgi:hypothetical protein
MVCEIKSENLRDWSFMSHGHWYMAARNLRVGLYIEAVKSCDRSAHLGSMTPNGVDSTASPAGVLSRKLSNFRHGEDMDARRECAV